MAKKTDAQKAFIAAQLKKFWYWCDERQEIYYRKEEGDPWPWTKDPILQEYKFCNVFRLQDRVTVDYMQQVGGRGLSNPKMVWQTVAYRIFNWPDTFKILKNNGLINKWNCKEAIRVLQRVRKSGRKVFTGAYIVTNAGRAGKDKIELICEECLTPAWDRRYELSRRLCSTKSLQRGVEIIRELPMVGNFSGYEMITDLRHTAVMWDADDIYTWANPGPGAKRGIHRLLTGSFRKPQRRRVRVDYNGCMQQLLEDKPRGAPNLPPMEMRDIEHSLCEFDKYMRIYQQEGTLRNKYRPNLQEDWL